jgi:hypothetical protein
MSQEKWDSIQALFPYASNSDPESPIPTSSVFEDQKDENDWESEISKEEDG